jgi:hypothetical protein
LIYPATRARGVDYACIPEHCVSDLRAVYDYAQSFASEISLFACSMGAYFSLLAYHDLTLRQSLFLSPVVNMERVIANMMRAFGVSEERLRAEKIIPLPVGQTLDWDYYRYVRANPVCFEWKSPTAILYGSADNVSEWEEISAFATRYGAAVKFSKTGRIISIQRINCGCSANGSMRI